MGIAFAADQEQDRAAARFFGLADDIGGFLRLGDGLLVDLDNNITDDKAFFRRNGRTFNVCNQDAADIIGNAVGCAVGIRDFGKR